MSKYLLMPDQLDNYSWAIVCMAGIANHNDWDHWFEFVSCMWEDFKFDPIECKDLREYLN